MLDKFLGWNLWQNLTSNFVYLNWTWYWSNSHPVQSSVNPRWIQSRHLYRDVNKKISPARHPWWLSSHRARTPRQKKCHRAPEPKILMCTEKKLGGKFSLSDFVGWGCWFWFATATQIMSKTLTKQSHDYSHNNGDFCYFLCNCGTGHLGNLLIVSSWLKLLAFRVFAMTKKKVSSQ